MVVPNYVPDPLEIPGNVTLEPYKVRLQFLRRVLSLHLLSLLVLGVLFVLPLPRLLLPGALILLLGSLVALCLVRISLRGTKAEVVVSAWSLPALLIIVAIFIRAFANTGLPVWSPMVGVVCAYVYSLLCGRDFSFVGQYVLALIASSVIIAGASMLLAPYGWYHAIALAMNAAYLTYYVYDSASLLSRRRLGEELGAVVDLYRDVLNVFGYVPRVVHHWHKHRIWQLR